MPQFRASLRSSEKKARKRDLGEFEKFKPYMAPDVQVQVRRELEVRDARMSKTLQPELKIVRPLMHSNPVKMMK